MQFLPSDSERHQVVQELLSGDNFHFGNPFMKWQDLFLNIFTVLTWCAVFSMCMVDLIPFICANIKYMLYVIISLMYCVNWIYYLFGLS